MVFTVLFKEYTIYYIFGVCLGGFLKKDFKWTALSLVYDIVESQTF